MKYDILHVHDLNLWAHVGVFEKERDLGQKFILDFSIWMDIQDVSSTDDLEHTVDYGLAISGVQELAFKINCLTIEKFSNQILDFLESIYGPVPIRVLLKKCHPPVNGFEGSVLIERTRNMFLLE